MMLLTISNEYDDIWEIKVMYVETFHVSHLQKYQFLIFLQVSLFTKLPFRVVQSWNFGLLLFVMFPPSLCAIYESITHSPERRSLLTFEILRILLLLISNWTFLAREPLCKYVSCLMCYSLCHRLLFLTEIVSIWDDFQNSNALLISVHDIKNCILFTCIQSNNTCFTFHKMHHATLMYLSLQNWIHSSGKWLARSSRQKHQLRASRECSFCSMSLRNKFF